MMLLASRICLLLFLLLWGGTMLADYFHIVLPDWVLGVSSYTAIGIAISAAACVIFQFVIPPKSN